MDTDLTAALAAVLVRLPVTQVRGSAHLRYELGRELTETDRTQHRRRVHMVCAAVDENLPARLGDLQPLTPDDLDHLARDLAAVRGWELEAAESVVTIWAGALGARPGVESAGDGAVTNVSASSPTAMTPTASTSTTPIMTTQPVEVPGTRPVSYGSGLWSRLWRSSSARRSSDG